MTVERIAPLVVAMLYLATAVSYGAKKDMPMLVLWSSYAIGNVAIVWGCWTR